MRSAGGASGFSTRSVRSCHSQHKTHTQDKQTHAGKQASPNVRRGREKPCVLLCACVCVLCADLCLLVPGDAYVDTLRDQRHLRVHLHHALEHIAGHSHTQNTHTESTQSTHTQGQHGKQGTHTHTNASVSPCACCAYLSVCVDPFVLLFSDRNRFG